MPFKTPFPNYDFLVAFLNKVSCSPNTSMKNFVNQNATLVFRYLEITN